VKSKFRARLVVTGLAVLLALMSTSERSDATTLDGTFTVDNGFFAYVSTNPNLLGTLVASSGAYWSSSKGLTFTLAPGQTYYLQVEAINAGGWGAFVGQFALSDSQFQFSNGSQTLLTNAMNWLGTYSDSNDSLSAQPWVTPSGTVVSFGANLATTFPWGSSTKNTFGVDQAIPGIDTNALWIWPTDALTEDTSLGYYGVCQLCTVDFMTTITPTTPLPATFPLFTTGLGVLGLFGRRRKRKAAALTA
jgi:hypothetical protein